MDIIDVVIEIRKIKDFEEINKEIKILKELIVLLQDIRIYQSLKNKNNGNK